MSHRGRASGACNKFRVSLGLPVGAIVNCADNSGAKNLCLIAVKGIHGRLNRLPAAAVGDMVVCTVKKGKPELRKKVLQGVIVRQRRPWRRQDGTVLRFEGALAILPASLIPVSPIQFFFPWGSLFLES